VNQLKSIFFILGDARRSKQYIISQSKQSTQSQIYKQSTTPFLSTIPVTTTSTPSTTRKTTSTRTTTTIRTTTENFQQFKNDINRFHIKGTVKIFTHKSLIKIDM
jgi:hypothetical protein